MKYVSYGNEYDLEFRKGTYSNNGRLAIQVVYRVHDGQCVVPYCMLTVNLPDIILSSDGSKDMPSNMTFVDTNNCPKSLIMLIAEEGYMTMTRSTAQSGFCTYPLVKFNEDWLKSLLPI